MRPLCASGEAAPCGERTKCFSTEGNRQGNSAELRFQDLAARRAQGGRREPARPDACSGPVKPYRLCVWGGGGVLEPRGRARARLRALSVDSAARPIRGLRLVSRFAPNICREVYHFPTRNVKRAQPPPSYNKWTVQSGGSFNAKNAKGNTQRSRRAAATC